MDGSDGSGDLSEDVSEPVASSAVGVVSCWFNSQSGKGVRSAKGARFSVEESLTLSLDLGSLGSLVDSVLFCCLRLEVLEALELGLLGVGIGVDPLKALDPELHIGEPRRRGFPRFRSGLVHDDVLGQQHHRRLVVRVEVLSPVVGDVGDGAAHLHHVGLGAGGHGLGLHRLLVWVVGLRHQWGLDVGPRLGWLDRALLPVGLPQPFGVGQDLADGACVH